MVARPIPGAPASVCRPMGGPSPPAYRGGMSRPEIRSNPPTIRRWLPGSVDALAGIAAAGIAAVVLAQPGGADFRSPDLLAWSLTGLGAGALAWARRAPVAAVVVTSVCGIVLGIRANHVDVLPFVLTLLLFSTGYYQASRSAVAA